MKVNPLIQLGNVPVQTGTIAAYFDHLAAPNEKVRAFEKDGQLIRLKRGLYVVDERVSGRSVVRVAAMGIEMVWTDSGACVYHDLCHHQANEGVRE